MTLTCTSELKTLGPTTVHVLLWSGLTVSAVVTQYYMGSLHLLSLLTVLYTVIGQSYAVQKNDVDKKRSPHSASSICQVGGGIVSANGD